MLPDNLTWPHAQSGKCAVCGRRLCGHDDFAFTGSPAGSRRGTATTVAPDTLSSSGVAHAPDAAGGGYLPVIADSGTDAIPIHVQGDSL